MNAKRVFSIFAASVFLLAGPTFQSAASETTSESNNDYGRPGLAVTSLPKEAQTSIQKLHVGMTRAEIESLHGFFPDGGLYDPLAPRYFLLPISADSTCIMLDLSFQPAEMPDAVYQDEKRRRDWVRQHEEYFGAGPHDVLRGIGRPYLKRRSID